MLINEVPHQAQRIHTADHFHPLDQCLSSSSTNTCSNNYDYSRQLDVHRWSAFPEADKFVHDVYTTYFTDHRSAIQRKHVGVILLDLYVAWLHHPDLMLAVHM